MKGIRAQEWNQESEGFCEWITKDKVQKTSDKTESMRNSWI